MIDPWSTAIEHIASSLKKNKKLLQNLLTNNAKCDIIYIERERDTKNLNPLQKENNMTKTAMINYIKKTGMVLDFSRSYFNRMSKDRVTDLYNRAKEYAKRYNLNVEG